MLALLKASSPGERRPQRGACLLPSQAVPLSPFHKMAGGGTVQGGWSPLNAFRHCRHGRISPVLPVAGLC